ncbi:MAG: hypothetical protein RLZ33_666 [Bacteroidota bacterium]|jgi:hypothetical protein
MATKGEIRANTSSTSEIEGKIKGMFFLMQSTTEKFLEELDRSYELYKIGEKTEIAKKLEEIATGQKIGNMETELIGKLLNTLNSLGKKVVVDGFLKNSEAVERAFLLSENDSRILYGLVPKENKEEELRKSISNFYAQTSNWEMFKYTEPLFQVIPKNLSSKVKFKASIK